MKLKLLCVSALTFAFFTGPAATAQSPAPTIGIVVDDACTEAAATEEQDQAAVDAAAIAA